MSVGKKWLERSHLNTKARTTKKETPKESRVRAKPIIDSIPQKIEAALAANKLSIDLTESWIEHSDVVCNNLEALADNPERGKPLVAEDFIGHLKIVVEWCLKNDLACFLDARNVNLNDLRYWLIARPKQ